MKNLDALTTLLKFLGNQRYKTQNVVAEEAEKLSEAEAELNAFLEVNPEAKKLANAVAEQEESLAEAESDSKRVKEKLASVLLATYKATEKKTVVKNAGSVRVYKKADIDYKKAKEWVINKEAWGLLTLDKKQYKDKILKPGVFDDSPGRIIEYPRTFVSSTGVKEYNGSIIININVGKNNVSFSLNGEEYKFEL